MGQAHRVPTITGARGNSKTDRYSNVTSLELNYTQARHMRGSQAVQQGPSGSRVKYRSHRRRRTVTMRQGIMAGSVVVYWAALMESRRPVPVAWCLGYLQVYL